MGFYSRHIWPRLLDYLLQGPPLDDMRRELLSHVEEEVLEVGFGTGLNLPFYPARIRKLHVVDVNPGLNPLARKRIEASKIEVDCRLVEGGRLPFPDGLFRSVVSTWTLCSVKNVPQLLREVRRVLRPDGRFYFLEHGLSDDPKVQRWQRLTTPFQKFWADGCHLDRDIKALVEGEFEILNLKRFYMEGSSKSHGYTYLGWAGVPRKG